MFVPGEPAPWFTARSNVNERFTFDTVAGRYIVLAFFESSSRPDARQFLAAIERQAHRFDLENFAFLGVTVDPRDEPKLSSPPTRGITYFWDFEREVSRLYGAADPAGAQHQPVTFVLDQALRFLAVLPWPERDMDAHVATLLQVMDHCPPLNSLTGCAPVLVLPHIFERSFCRELIEYHQRQGGRESGYMRDVDGKTVEIHNYGYKRRTDCELRDPELVKAAQARLRRRLVPELQKAFQFQATRIERHLVACYDAAEGGHFRAHRDNTTRGTAHRRFAVTINLNAEEFEGGNLWFPEFGRRAYRPPTGGAVVFSCSLLHEATPVTKGRRFAFLPFLYDEDAAQVRQANLPYLASEDA